MPYLGAGQKTDSVSFSGSRSTGLSRSCWQPVPPIPNGNEGIKLIRELCRSTGYRTDGSNGHAGLPTRRNSWRCPSGTSCTTR